MTAVFVHGNPETAAVWGPLLDELGRSDVVLLSPPGFGAPLPDGFGAHHWSATRNGRPLLVVTLDQLGSRHSAATLEAAYAGAALGLLGELHRLAARAGRRGQEPGGEQRQNPRTPCFRESCHC